MKISNNWLMVWNCFNMVGLLYVILIQLVLPKQNEITRMDLFSVSVYAVCFIMSLISTNELIRNAESKHK